MGGRMSRNKGARGEREVIAMLQPIVDRVCDHCGKARFELKRNYSQRFAAKQYDIDGLPWMALEVKRCENLSGLGGWWRQCLAATRDRQTPVLIYRKNNAPWTVRLKVPMRIGDRGSKKSLRGTVTIDIQTFLVYFEERLKYELNC